MRHHLEWWCYLLALSVLKHSNRHPPFRGRRSFFFLIYFNNIGHELVTSLTVDFNFGIPET